MRTKHGMVAMVGTLALILAGSAAANGGLKPEEMIKFRKAGYNFMAWNMGKIKANLGETFNKEEVARAAAAIAATANAGMGALYAPGTDKSVGGEKTRLKSEFFKEPEKVREIAMNFNTQANELAKVAASGDAKAVGAQFGKVGDACKACHERYREK